MGLRIGYFVPEFPGQTHIFFWREMARLEQLGAELQVISTRRPPQKITSHTWSEQAKQRTIYLLDGVGIRFILESLAILVLFTPRAWLRCLRSIGKSRVSLRGKLELALLAIFGGRLARLAKREGLSHLHVHSCANAANIALFAKLLSGLPYSLTLHGPLGDYGPNQAEKWGAAAFGIVITQKLLTALREELSRDLKDSLSLSLHIAPMGVNLEVFQRHAPYHPWSGKGPAQIYCVGRLNPCKGHADLIRAIAILKGKGLTVKLTIAGEDELGGTGYHRDLQSLIDDLGLGQEVHLLGAVSEHVIRDGLCESHVFALASLHEPLGVAIMEAMALEMPIVVTSGGGVTELVDDGKDGLLVVPENPVAMAEALERVLNEPVLAETLAQASRKKIVDQFQDTRSALMLLELIRRNRSEQT